MIELTLLAIACIFALPILVLLVECVAASHTSAKNLALEVGARESELGHRSSLEKSSLARPSVDILIPAHNEAGILGSTLNSVRKQLREGDRLCVVADNCTDATAAIAAKMGADVVTRWDQEHRAKGYAVAAGLKHLDQDSRDVVLMLDADCEVSEGGIDELANAAIRFDAPAQGNYKMPNASTGNSWNAISSFAVTVKNQVRPRGLQRAGFRCQLTGSGMAFPAHLARLPNWANDDIVEDMKASYDFLLSRHGPVFCPSAIVTASLPKQRTGAMEQRRRWEHGHLQTLVTLSPRLLRSAIVGARPDLLVAALDLMIPPLSLLVQVWAVTFAGICGATLLLGLSALPALISGSSGIALACAIMCAW